MGEKYPGQYSNEECFGLKLAMFLPAELFRTSLKYLIYTVNFIDYPIVCMNQLYGIFTGHRTPVCCKRWIRNYNRLILTISYLLLCFILHSLLGLKSKSRDSFKQI